MEEKEATSFEDMAVSLMTDVKSLSRMYSLGLRETYFEDLTNKRAYEFATEYWQDSGLQSAPSKSVMEAEVSGLHVLSTDNDAVYVIKSLKNQMVGNRLKRTLLQSADVLVSNPTEALQQLSKDVWNISKQAKDRKNSSFMKDDITARNERYKRRSDMAKRGLVGMSIGFPEIDQETMGLADGELCVIAAPTKTGKTWIGLNIIAKAMESRKRSVFFTLELSVADIEDRLDAIISGVSYSRLSTGRLSSAEMSTLKRAQKRYDKLGEVEIYKPKLGERTVPDMIKIARDFNADVIVIDQLSFMESTKPSISKTEQATRIIDELKTSISEDEENMLPVYLLSQMNRAASFTDNGRGKMTNIALSSNIENASDLIIGLGSTREQKMNNTMVIEILGSRRTGMKSWLVYRNLQDKTDIHVIREITDEEKENDDDSE